MAPTYSMSPQVQIATPQSPAAPPNYINPQAPPAQQNYASPYMNGGSAPLSMPTPTTATTPVTTPTLHLPEARQTFTPNLGTPAPPTPPIQQYTATMTPIAPPPPPNQGVMGPPSKPAEKPTKEYEYDVSDSLAGTGIDLRAEEQFLADFYAGSFAQEARTGAPANAPGGKGSFYGAGLANQPAQFVDAQAQEKFATEAAKKAWEDATHRLAVSRANEINDAFLRVPLLHHRAEKIAKEHGIGLNLDIKNQMGKMKNPQDFAQPKITVSTKMGPDGAMVMTSGSWIPHDAFLADQIALLSIATRHRIRELIEEANIVATTRQTTSNGEVPDEWTDVAAPLKTVLDPVQDPESAVSPLTNPLKRSFDASNASSSSVAGKTAQNRQVNHLTKAIREVGEVDRKVEDARLRKRQKRLNPETATAGSRSGSAVPGTPGSIAPEESKAPSKKELKKGAALAKAAEASSTANANQTLNTLMGGFGGRKKGKQYAWMTSGGSGASTPSRINTQGGPVASVATAGSKAPEEMRPTLDSRTRLGGWRENVQGKNIQLRDWITVLEMDGLDVVKAVQDAYLKLDSTNTK